MTVEEMEAKLRAILRTHKAKAIRLDVTDPGPCSATITMADDSMTCCVRGTLAEAVNDLDRAAGDHDAKIAHIRAVLSGEKGN